jgi:hypothetical protein
MSKCLRADQGRGWDHLGVLLSLACRLLRLLFGLLAVLAGHDLALAPRSRRAQVGLHQPAPAGSPGIGGRPGPLSGIGG